MKNTLSALITIYNEENIISSCLSKLDFCDEIVVVLDKSTDKSKQICQKYTNNIFEGSFKYEGDRNRLFIINF